MAGVIQNTQEEAKVVMDYQPKKIESVSGKHAHDFVSMQQQTTSNFRMSDLVAQQTGVHELEKATLERRVEQMALERLNEIQESAYREAYNLGLEEGSQKGYDESKEEITKRLSIVNSIIENLIRIKSDILQRNEIQIIDLIYTLASKLALFEIERNKERIAPVLKAAMESLQKDESVVVKINPNDVSVIEALKGKASQDFEFLGRARVESSDGITEGGCVIETNYGLIDATIEERLSKLADALGSAKPNVKRDEFT